MLGRNRALDEDREANREASEIHPFAAPTLVTIVSGLPRSGTSLLMQLLGAAGLDLACDGARPPDLDNPRGYFELDAVRRLREDASFLARCRGRVVKIVAPLVLELSPSLPSRVVFVERGLDEVLASQRAMLMRRGEPWRAEQESQLRRAFEGLLQRCRTRFAMEEGPPVWIIDHGRLVRSPDDVIGELAEFLAATGVGIATPAQAEQALEARRAMASVVDPALHRQRG